jgi:hypothetical protein
VRLVIILILVLAATIQFSFASTPISGLPLSSASTTNTNDSFPYVDSVGLATKRIKLSDIQNIPAVAAAIAAAGGGGGSSGLTVFSVSTSAALSAGTPVNYQHIACDASAGSVTATLPVCAGHIGQAFNLKKIDSSSNSCSFARTGADLIDGQTSISNADQYVNISIVCRASGFWDRF